MRWWFSTGVFSPKMELMLINTFLWRPSTNTSTINACSNTQSLEQFQSFCLIWLYPTTGPKVFVLNEVVRVSKWWGTHSFHSNANAFVRKFNWWGNICHANTQINTWHSMKTVSQSKWNGMFLRYLLVFKHRQIYHFKEILWYHRDRTFRQCSFGVLLLTNIHYI